MKTFKAAYLFCGIGGGALGFQQARREYRGLEGQFRTLCGIDFDPEACQDFEAITGSRAVQMDLFSCEQYVAWHGQEPAEDWREVTAQDLRDAAGGEEPDIVFTSPPCKGFSALLPAKSANTAKYQALNGLTIRGIRLAAEAWRPALILMENVPRITTRGQDFLAEIKATLSSYGYVFHESTHDCGEIGGLGQHRQRYLLIARLPSKLPAFVYKPQKYPLKTIGDVIGPLPMPGTHGPMHRLPNLQWLTWLRLAIIPAGGDWRDLERSGWENLAITHEPRRDSMGVMQWEEPSSAVTGHMRPSGSTPAAVADPRIKDGSEHHNNVYRITRWEEPAGTITGGNRPSAGALCVADPRVNGRVSFDNLAYKVSPMDKPAVTVTGRSQPSNGAIAVADPRVKCKSTMAMLGVMDWDETASAVTGAARPGCGSSPASVADPRLRCEQRSGTFGVLDWAEPAPTISGNLDVHAGAAAVADVRIPEPTDAGQWIIISEDGTWHRPLTTLELAALQGLPITLHGQPLRLAGNSEQRWRERIGNMVPVGAGRGIANAMLDALLANEYHEVMYAAVTELWVRMLAKMRMRKLIGGR